PSVVRLNHISERWHGRAVHACHEDLVDILIGAATLEAGIVLTQGKVVRTNRIVLAVGESRGGGTIALPVRTVTLPAFQLREQGLAVGNALDGDRGLGRNGDGSAGFFGLPAGREDFDISDQVGALLFGERTPYRHVGVDDAASDRVVEILIGGQRAGQSGAALEGRDGEVAWLRIKPNRVLAVAIPLYTVTTDAVAAVIGLGVRSMPSDSADVTLHGRYHYGTQRSYLRLILGGGARSEFGGNDKPENRGEKTRADKTHWLQAVHSQHPSTEVSAGETSSPADSSSSEIKVNSEQQFASVLIGGMIRRVKRPHSAL